MYKNVLSKLTFEPWGSAYQITTINIEAPLNDGFANHEHTGPLALSINPARAVMATKIATFPVQAQTVHQVIVKYICASSRNNLNWWFSSPLQNNTKCVNNNNNNNNKLATQTFSTVMDYVILFPCQQISVTPLIAPRSFPHINMMTIPLKYVYTHISAKTLRVGK
jgi:hypothetical protein